MIINLQPNLYFVESSDSTTLLAYNLKEEGGYITFFDSVKNRFMKYNKIIENTEDRFVFQRDPSEADFIYTFRPFKYEDYLKYHKLFVLEKNINNLEEFKSLFEF
jgi:hypothetical protein